jgi:uncharacterized membrane protein
MGWLKGLACMVGHIGILGLVGSGYLHFGLGWGCLCDGFGGCGGGVVLLLLAQVAVVSFLLVVSLGMASSPGNSSAYFSQCDSLWPLPLQ